MKHLLLFVAFSFMSYQAIGAAVLTEKRSASILECDTIVLSSGHEIVGTILEDDGETYEISYCDKDLVVLIKKSSVSEIRYASGEVTDVQQLRREKQVVDKGRSKKLIRTGLILIGISLVVSIPAGFLAVALGLGGAVFLSTVVFLIPIAVFFVGVVSLIRGLFKRKKRG